MFVNAEDDKEDIDMDMEDTESTSAEDMFSEAGDEKKEEEGSTEEAAAPTDDEDEIVDDSDFDPVEVLGADLACSACELTLDTFVKKFATAESVIRRKLEEEAEEKEKEKEKEEEKKDGEDDEKKEEDEDKDEEATKDDDDDDDDDDDESDKKSKKKKKDKKKKKKDSKKKKKKEKKKKKTEIKVDKKAVADAVISKGCKPSDFESVKTIGSYPGRRYDSYGGYSGSSKNKKSSPSKSKKQTINLARAAKHFAAGHDEWIKQKLASPTSKEYKGMKKMKKSFCEVKNKMCKSAALGFEAESACLAKALRAMTAGEFEKASKISAKCPKVKSA